MDVGVRGIGSSVSRRKQPRSCITEGLIIFLIVLKTGEVGGLVLAVEEVCRTVQTNGQNSDG